MIRWFHALLCLAGLHGDGFYVGQGLYKDRYRCKECGRIYRA